MPSKYLVLSYGGRAGGALTAYMLAHKKVRNKWMLAGVVALGWLAGGYVTDRAIPALTGAQDIVGQQGYL